MQQFDILELDQDELDLAWPLVRASFPQLELAGWRVFAETLIDRGGGVVALSSSEGILSGVATYEAVDSDKLGRILNVETMVTAEFGGRQSARRALMQVVRAASQALDCSGVVISARRRPRPRGGESKDRGIH